MVELSPNHRKGEPAMTEQQLQQHDSSRTARVLVGVDGSDSSNQALRWAHEQATLTGRELHVVTAWSIPQAYGYTAMVASIGDLAEDAGKVQEQALEDTLGVDAAHSVHRHVVEGHPTTVMLGLAGPADLIVVGSHGHGGFVGSLLGSVSRYLVGHAPCPVVVIRTHCEPFAA
jgi:nucleotide-binding universal stress UspA family protein